MEPKYNHQLVETGKNAKWIAKKYFSYHDRTRPAFTIILPPPNITGKLHLGHAWDGYIQDTIIRYKKLNGFDVLFLPGMDHAGIATQVKVEEKLAKDHIYRKDISREEFLKHAHQWKNDYSAMIREQWGMLGLALDYPNERFTLDKGASEAVNKVFIELYKRGIIYRGERAVNWDPVLQTVLSDIEVIPTETKSVMYYYNYPLESGGSIKVATVRNETMFSEVALAVNPNDPKLKHLINTYAVSPLTKKRLIIVGDESIEISKGTGAMKVSAHGIVDYDIIKKHNLPLIESIDKNGRMNHHAGDMAGLDRFAARALIAERLKNYLYKKETIKNNVGLSQRSNAPVEILVLPQWFVKMAPLADKLLRHFNTPDAVKLYPARFNKTLTTWMENVHDWSISRQLWWGHQIPAWYYENQIKVQLESPGNEWTRDPDVLDTWFSSALAPFSFLGWPNQKTQVTHYYPTSLLVTGYDIIFFWVARMYFMGLEFMNAKPFERVLIHGLIRGEDGRKMSKSLGNGIDPLEVIEKYGSDALRFFLMNNSAPGLDLRYSHEKLITAWNLNNKLWNAARYIIEIMPNTSNEHSAADYWIEAKLAKLKQKIDKYIDTYDFAIIGREISQFITNDFSSWYLEFSKAMPNKKVASSVLQNLLILVHPFLPFITDHIYALLTKKELLENSYPNLKAAKSPAEMDKVIKIVSALRAFRDENKISKTVELEFNVASPIKSDSIKLIEKLTFSRKSETKDAIIPLGKIVLYVALTAEMTAHETERLTKEFTRLQSEITRSQTILSNKAFIAKAPSSKIAEEKAKLASYEAELDKVATMLKKVKNSAAG